MGVLRRYGMSRLARMDRVSGVVVRYQREHPGELVHLDVKKLGRIPDGGGHRIHGRAAARRGRGIGYDYIHSAVDDRSRVAFSQLLPDETGQTCARFLVEAAAFFADHGVRIQRVLTDTPRPTPSRSSSPRPPRAGHPAQADPSLPAPDQRQGRAIQPHPAR
jgi:hypothetical protein